jgi:uncharacterized protein
MTVTVIDTNLLLSALINPHGLPASIVRAWVERRSFSLATCEFQLNELRAVTRREAITRYITPAQAGRLVNQLHALAIFAPEPLPPVDPAAELSDPFDNFLLSCASATNAQFIISGDKSDVLSRERYRSTRIVSAAQFATIIGCPRAA